MQRRPDDGASTFDKFRSPHSVEIYPEGGITQKFCQTDTFNEAEEKHLEAERKDGWPSQWHDRDVFNIQINSAGQATFQAGRKLGPQRHFEERPTELNDGIGI